MEKIFSVLLVIASLHVSSQDNQYADTYVCKDGKVHFYASTPFEDISPASTVGLCVINTKTNKVSAKVEMKSFIFKNGMMQEHFNENYIQSEKYPYAILEAQIVEKINYAKDGVYSITLRGTFEVHGVKKPYEIKGKLTVQHGIPLAATADFEVKLVDHNIKIPTAVVVKVAEVVKVDVSFKFKKYEK
jgi:polyisoprenoid-binding protein YceI